MDTIQELQQETNRWLKTKWQHADFNRELPTVNQGIEYMEQLLRQWGNAHGGDVRKLINDKRKDRGIPETQADLEVITLWGFISSIGDTDNQQIRMVCGKGTENERTLAVFDCVVKHCELDGDIGDGLKSISLAEGYGVSPADTNTELTAFAIASNDLLTSVYGDDINERWMSASDFFRSEHPICPVCQGTVHWSRDPDTDEKGFLFCDCCDWDSHRRYNGRYDLGEKSVFQHEIKRALAEQKYKAKRAANVQALMEALKVAKTEFANRGKGFKDQDSHYKEQLKVLLQKAIEDIDKL